MGESCCENENQEMPKLGGLTIYLAWGVALLATLTSLYFSEVLKYPPCSLCWYQRVFMYPLVLILPIAIVGKDKNLSTYLLVFSFLGLIVAGYHSLIYHNIISETFKVCTADLSCKTKQFELFNFLSIPVMSFVSFTVLFLIGIKERVYEKRD